MAMIQDMRNEISGLGYKALLQGYRKYLEENTSLCASTIKASGYGALFLFRFDRELFWDVVFSSDEEFRDKAKEAVRKAVKEKGLSWNDEHSVISRVYHLSSFRDYAKSLGSKD